MNRKLVSLIALILVLVLSLSVGLIACSKKDTVEDEKESGEQESTTHPFVKDGEKDISIGVLADVHVMSATQAVDMTCDDFKSWEAHGQKMLGLSESILKTTVDRIIAESDFDVVLVSGDNADDGGEASHRAVAAELKRLEDAGIKVYTIPGNHDINNNSYTYAGGKAALTNPTTEKEFAEIYADFGYNSTDTLEFYKNVGTSAALNEDTFALGDNLSYVADLGDKYRLIAIDMCKYVSDYYLTDKNGSYAAAGYQVDGAGRVLVNGEPYPLVSNRHDGAMTSGLLDWAQAKTEQAVTAGKIPVGMMHFPLIQHFGPLVQAGNAAVNEPYKDRYVADVLADAGMKFIFTGHIHMQDNALYTSKAGNKILDINSASLSNYPTPVRYFRAKGTEAYVRTWNMDYIKESYLPSYLSDSEKAAIKKDFIAYSVDYLDGSMLAKVKNKVDMELIYDLLSVLGVESKGANDAAVTALAEGVYNEIFLRFLSLPLYEKDAQGKLSVEAAAKEYGVTIPASDYTSVFNLAMSFAAALYGGDESLSMGDTRIELLKYSIYTAVKIVADYDFFAKVKELNPSYANINLSLTLHDLYLYGALDVCNDNLLVGLISSLDIDEIKAYLDFNEDTDPFNALGQIVALASSVDLGAFLKGIEININDYIALSESDRIGDILIGDIIDDYIASSLLLGLSNDSLESGSSYEYLDGTKDNAPADNCLKINITTMAYSALK